MKKPTVIKKSPIVAKKRPQSAKRTRVSTNTSTNGPIKAFRDPKSTGKIRMNHSPGKVKIPTRPPSTFGRDTDATMSDRDGNSKFKNFNKMSVTEQRNISRDYLAKKVKEIKVKY